MKKTFKTNNYDMFGVYEFNREVYNEANIRAIMSEMEKFGFDEWNPLIVGASGKVADGQHRLEAAKRLGIEVWVDQFNKEFTVEDIRRMNRNRVNWSRFDFFHSMVDDENAQRMVGFIKWAEVQGFSKGSSERIAKNANHKSHARRYNDFAGITDAEMNVAVTLIKELVTIKPYCQAYNKDRFIGAYIRARESEGFDLTTFIKQLAKHPINSRLATTELFAIEIEDIYNSGLRRGKITVDKTNITRH